MEYGINLPLAQGLYNNGDIRTFVILHPAVVGLRGMSRRETGHFSTDRIMLWPVAGSHLGRGRLTANAARQTGQQCPLGVSSGGAVTRPQQATGMRHIELTPPGICGEATHSRQSGPHQAPMQRSVSDGPKEHHLRRGLGIGQQPHSGTWRRKSNPTLVLQVPHKHGARSPCRLPWLGKRAG
ncbi:hypothetical protein ASPZODRAFT_144448 [Penicilliopsis zonata CBS 506.65]|uniref:Uncharacterized protein n=1 Tax=Penicilliopsis zonata CBS 506.65 TaxID=1073090 RepID=A0A1L9SD51_9EURO|nr:hypothetical protein ASPZODRAFT_144448 [Penicilliopsis zonata CBS 506.65]OJJ45150.1 hypothetical protein ASPZODRAFT_144448 [Penicilliopsis zonata CBS 506.65]